MSAQRDAADRSPISSTSLHLDAAIVAAWSASPSPMFSRAPSLKSRRSDSLGRRPEFSGASYLASTGIRRRSKQRRQRAWPLRRLLRHRLFIPSVISSALPTSQHSGSRRFSLIHVRHVTLLVSGTHHKFVFAKSTCCVTTLQPNVILLGRRLGSRDQTRRSRKFGSKTGPQNE
jgi:hypothetical protein